MLLRQATLEKIQAGEITLVFRRWKRPTVRTGGTLRTGVGVLTIVDVSAIEEKDILDADARRAGYATKEAVLDDVRASGTLYRIEVGYAGSDPRIALRENDRLTDDEFGILRSRLERLDRRSKNGPWTRSVLEAIGKHPRLPAARLAENTGYEKARLKENVRKLKNLGLTVSHHPGYTLSPRGRALLEKLRK